MEKTANEGLAQILSEFLSWNKYRIECLSQMMIGLLKVQTVNLSKLACTLESGTQLASRQQRLRRFLSQTKFDQAHFTQWMLRLFVPNGEKIILAMDRTNWKWGSTNINILLISLVYKGCSIPLMWSLLDKQGNSNAQERISLCQELLKVIDRQRVEAILADREFIGETWFLWLKENAHINGCIRIKHNFCITDASGKTVHVSTLFSSLKSKEHMMIAQPQTICGVSGYLAALRLDDGELLITFTFKPLSDPITLYAKRWQIETLFGCLKSKGFNLEDTHVTDPKRLSTLLHIVCLAFAWAFRTGLWFHRIKPIPIKKTLHRPSRSFFRYGLDLLHDALLNQGSTTPWCPFSPLIYPSWPPCQSLLHANNQLV